MSSQGAIQDQPTRVDAVVDEDLREAQRQPTARGIAGEGDVLRATEILGKGVEGPPRERVRLDRGVGGRETVERDHDVQARVGEISPDLIFSAAASTTACISGVTSEALFSSIA